MFIARLCDMKHDLEQTPPKILCLINARGGSKGVPWKNIKPLGRKPLIGYSIEAAKASKLISHVVVSTDSMDIADVARNFGADVPFMRPAELASDTAKQIDAIIHAINFMEERGNTYDYICILQPTCPFRSVDDVDGALNLLISSGGDSVITVTDVGGRHPNTLYTMADNQQISPYVQNDGAGVLRQNFESLYWRTGSVYAMRRDVVMNEHSLYGKDIRGYPQPEERAFNIDSPFDWDLCEAYLAFRQSKETTA